MRFLALGCTGEPQPVAAQALLAEAGPNRQHCGQTPEMIAPQATMRRSAAANEALAKYGALKPPASASISMLVQSWGEEEVRAWRAALLPACRARLARLQALRSRGKQPTAADAEAATGALVEDTSSADAILRVNQTQCYHVHRAILCARSGECALAW